MFLNRKGITECKNTVIGATKGVASVLLWFMLVTVLSTAGIIWMCYRDMSFLDTYLNASISEQITLLLPLSIIVTIFVDLIMIIVSLIRNKSNPYIQKPTAILCMQMILLAMVSFIIISLIEPFLPVDESYVDAFLHLEGMGIWAQFGYVVLIGPILEEVLCRHMVIDSFKTTNKVVPIVVSALLFAVLHGNLTQGIPAFVVGLLLGYIYVKTGNLLYTIIFHIVFNSLGIFASIPYVLFLIGIVVGLTTYHLLSQKSKAIAS